MTTRRSGIALVEMMLGIVIATGLLVVLSIAVSRLYRANTVAHEHAQTVTTLGRFGEQFRRDAHASSQVSIEQDDAAGKLQLAEADGRQIVYQIIPGGVERTTALNDQVVQRETYLLPGMQPLAWQHAADDRQLSLSVGRLANRETIGGKISGQFSILAVLPRSHEKQTP